MHDQMLKKAVSAFAPTNAIMSRVRARISEMQKPISKATIVFLHRDAEKIMTAVFAKYEKTMQKIA